MAVLDQSNTSTVGSVILRRSDGTENHYWAQSFVCGANGTLDSIAISLSKSGSPTGNLTVKLFADSGGVNPTGSALSSSTTSLDVSTVSTSQTEYSFTFPNDYTLVSGTKYWLRIESTTTASNTNCINIWYSNANPYASGNINRSSDGITWLTDQGTNDAYFKDFINLVVSSIQQNYSFFM